MPYPVTGRAAPDEKQAGGTTGLDRHHRLESPVVPASGPTARWTALGFMSLLCVALLGGAAPVRACPLTAPNCAVDKVQDVAEDPVSEVERTVKDTVDEAPVPVEETVEEVEDTVGDVEETVDETIDPGKGGTQPPPPPTDPGDPGDPRDPKDPKKDDDGKTRTVGSQERRGSDRRDDEQRVITGPAPVDPPRTDPAGRVQPTTAETSSTDIDRGLRESAIEAAKTFAFPLVMTVLVGIFLAVQHRVDQKDPKFVLAPVEQQFLSFE